MQDIESLPRAGAAPMRRGAIRVHREDFYVQELLPHVPEGTGEHLWIKIRKSGYNTRQVAKLLARIARVRILDVGYAGLKDRQAVTEQWFSIRLAARKMPSLSELPSGIEVRQAGRHHRKLRPGAGRGNRFRIVVRDARGSWDEVPSRLREFTAIGVPNYFGAQRFGVDGRNPERALAMFRSGRRPRRGSEDSLYVSAARSLIFNHVLALRVREGCWNRAVSGDILCLDGTPRWFVPDRPDSADIEYRLDVQDVHPSGPLWGLGSPQVTDEARWFEETAVRQLGEYGRGLERLKSRPGRRPLRLRVRNLRWSLHPARRRMTLEFELGSGGYATTVLQALFAELGSS